MILGAVRTPCGKFGGSLLSLTAVEWGGIVIGAAIRRGARWGMRMGSGEIVDGVVYDGLTDPLLNVHMGEHGSTVAAEEKVGREEQNAWAYRCPPPPAPGHARQPLADSVSALRF